MRSSRRLAISLLSAATWLSGGRITHADDMRLPSDVRMEDVTFHSAALGHDMTYRVMLPTAPHADGTLPVVWLLHGYGGHHKNWSTLFNMADFTRKGVMLVMPDGENSYYANSPSDPTARFEDYIIQDLVANVRSRFPSAATDRAHNAIVGYSMGGYGAAVLALRHRELFSFVGAMSAPLDLMDRPITDPTAVATILKAFGPAGGENRRAEDPFLLIDSSPETVPYFYVTCGDQETSYDESKRFVKQLKQRGIPAEFRSAIGRHDAAQWNRQLPDLEASLLKHLNSPTKKAAKS